MAIKLPREHIIRAVSVILRVPALFIAEAWYRTDPMAVHRHWHPQSTQFVKNSIPDSYVAAADGQYIKEMEKTHEILIHTVYYIAIVFALALMVLPLKKLVTFYMYLVSGGLLMAAHFLSFIYVEEEQKESQDIQSVFEDRRSVQRLGISIVLQGVLCGIIGYLIDLRHTARMSLLIYTLPMLARLGGYPVEDLHRLHNFASLYAILLITFFIFNKIPIVLDLAKTGLQKIGLAVQLYGWIPFLLAMWFKILLPIQFLIFWIALFTLQMFKYYSFHNHPIFNEGWMVVLLASISECCVTPISMMGLCVTVSYISYLVLTFTKILLQGPRAINDNMMHRGWTEGFTMFLLAMQTGLIELKASHRAFLMSIVLFIVVSSLVQSMYEITDPILLALGASQSKSVFKHGKAILLCTFLWMFPLYMTYLISQFFDIDFWLLVVISSCVLTSVQVVGSMVVYGLFIYDAIRGEPWENLDDIVYYAKATTRILEFIVAVFVVMYGVRESIFGDWSWFNSSILIIHCYFNVWQRLQAGWKSYLLRREAVKKIESLPQATPEQLADLSDLCAICFQELQTACITPCNHFFHAICLRKWLYVQESCPLCHQKVTSSESSSEQQDNEHNENVQANAEAAAAAAGEEYQDHDVPYQPRYPQGNGQQRPEAFRRHPPTGLSQPNLNGSARNPPPRPPMDHRGTSNVQSTSHRVHGGGEGASEGVYRER